MCEGEIRPAHLGDQGRVGARWATLARLACSARQCAAQKQLEAGDHWRECREGCDSRAAAYRVTRAWLYALSRGSGFTLFLATARGALGAQGGGRATVQGVGAAARARECSAGLPRVCVCGAVRPAASGLEVKQTRG